MWKYLRPTKSTFVVIIERCNKWKQLEIYWIFRNSFLEVKNNDNNNTADNPVKIFGLWEIFRENTLLEPLSLQNLVYVKFIAALRQSGIRPLRHRPLKHDFFTPKLWVLYFSFRCKRRYWSREETRGASDGFHWVKSFILPSTSSRLFIQLWLRKDERNCTMILEMRCSRNCKGQRMSNLFQHPFTSVSE